VLLPHRVSFRHPCNSADNGRPPRTALLLPGFKRQASVKSFAPATGHHKWLEKLEQFAPESMAGSLGELLFLASLRCSKALRLDALRHSLVVIFQTEQPWITREDREDLWAAFGLPVYEQIYSITGLLATECEAHDGLHIAPGAIWNRRLNGELWFREPASWWEDRGDAFAPSGLFGDVEEAPCPCGRPTPRLRILGPSQRQVLRNADVLAPKAFAEVA
jgi:hypothetical protein